MKMRYEYKVPVFNSGPFLPHFTGEECLECGACENACPVGALIVVDMQVIPNLDDCLGCGLCASACPKGNFTMVKHEERVDREPGRFRMILSLIYAYAVLIPSVAIFKLFTGSQMYKHDQPPRKVDLYKG